MSTVSETDRIERKIVINAPRARVWQALANAEEFGKWFGADLTGQTFVPGQRARALKSACGNESRPFEIIIERLEEQQLLSYRWHPYAVDPAAQEPLTLVTFTLQDTPEQGTLLTVVESGFDQIPPERRLESFRMHTQGWEQQLENVARHASH